VRVAERAGAEDRLADPHDGRAFLDGDLEIPGHAHRKPGQPGVGQDRLVAQRAQQPEAGPHTVGVGAEHRQRHQAARFKPGIIGEPFDEGQQRVRLQAELAGFSRGVDLHEHIEVAPLRLQAAIEGLGQLDAVEGVKFGGEARQIFGLVALQMADDVPPYRQVAQLRVFVTGLLQLVLAGWRPEPSW